MATRNDPLVGAPRTRLYEAIKQVRIAREDLAEDDEIPDEPFEFALDRALGDLRSIHRDLCTERSLAEGGEDA